MNKQVIFKKAFVSMTGAPRSHFGYLSLFALGNLLGCASILAARSFI